MSLFQITLTAACRENTTTCCRNFTASLIWPATISGNQKNMNLPRKAQKIIWDKLSRKMKQKISMTLASSNSLTHYTKGRIFSFILKPFIYCSEKKLTTLKKKVCWINKIGVSRGVILICFQLNTIRNWTNYFIDWKQKHNNKMYLLNYV